jgi:hypothetical protein
MNDSYGELYGRVRFLVSDDASWITGITLDVAGGATMVR